MVALGELTACWSSVHCVRVAQADCVVTEHVPFRKVSALPHGSSSQSPLATLQSSVDGLSPYTALALYPCDPIETMAVAVLSRVGTDTLSWLSAPG